MNYRLATRDDAALLAELNYQLIGDEGSRNPMNHTQLIERMQHWLESEYQAVLFFLNYEPIAYAIFRPEPDAIYLRQFFVARSRRRSGVGRCAMRILINDVWPPDCRVTVDVLVHNQPGRAFWQAVGFKEYSLTLEMKR